MKKRISVELKLIFAAVVVLLAFLTAAVGVQIYRNNKENVTFVYNSASTNLVNEVNIFDIFPGI